MRFLVKILLILAIASIVLSWPARSLWRSIQLRQIYSVENPPAPSITPAHIAAIRKLRFAWNSIVEGGGPVVDPWTPYGSTDLSDDLAPLIFTQDPVAIARFHRDVSSILIRALHTCQLQPGRYTLTHLNNAWMEERLRSSLAGVSSTRIQALVAEFPHLSPDQQFDFTDQHRRLLRALVFEWPDDDILSLVPRGGHPAPVVDFKRPFGEMTAFEIDMAAILQRPRPSAGTRDVVLERLYREMWPALQAFVEHAPLENCVQ